MMSLLKRTRKCCPILGGQRDLFQLQLMRTRELFSSLEEVREKEGQLGNGLPSSEGCLNEEVHLLMRMSSHVVA